MNTYEIDYNFREGIPVSTILCLNQQAASRVCALIDVLTTVFTSLI